MTRGATMVASLITLAVIAMASSADANPTQPEKLWDGFRAPTGIATAPDGTVYVSNWGAGTVERIGVDGVRSTALTGIAAPAGIAIDGAGAVFVASYSDDDVLRLAPDGTRTRVASGLATPAGLGFAADGRLLVANRAAGEIVSIDLSNGTQRILARSLSLPVGVVEMMDGSVITSQYGGRVTRILADGSTQELGASFSRPGVGIVADGPDAVLVADNGASVVRRVSMDGRSAVVASGFEGSLVALGRGRDGHLLVGAWGSGIVYRSRVAR
ncbi:serine/threonine protein kinase [Methylobacterium terricola]|uniref:Serine/threonine protein kinase n=1 Tax=Methylobacterium terricola TaxID=2583531 RepID=A0A5C4LG68_9HYPH|nr:serine/threonine protein kinase [Methylobacterium terricola]TNC11758.1 serine/threonine protein kinase [Methylobacterium terricola]